MLRQTLPLLMAQWVFISELPGRSLLGHLHLSKRHQSEVSHLRGRYTRLDIKRNMLVSWSLIHFTRSIIDLSYQYPFAPMSTNEISNLMVRFCIIYLLALKVCPTSVLFKMTQNERFTNPNIGIQLDIHHSSSWESQRLYLGNWLGKLTLPLLLEWTETEISASKLRLGVVALCTLFLGHKEIARLDQTLQQSDWEWLKKRKLCQNG